MSHITPQPEEKMGPGLLQSALTALVSVIGICAVRMEGWKWIILDGICKRWVVIKDQTNNSGISSFVILSLVIIIALRYGRNSHQATLREQSLGERV